MAVRDGLAAAVAVTTVLTPPLCGYLELVPWSSILFYIIAGSSVLQEKVKSVFQNTTLGNIVIEVTTSFPCATKCMHYLFILPLNYRFFFFYTFIPDSCVCSIITATVEVLFFNSYLFS